MVVGAVVVEDVFAVVDVVAFVDVGLDVGMVVVVVVVVEVVVTFVTVGAAVVVVVVLFVVVGPDVVVDEVGTGTLVRLMVTVGVRGYTGGGGAGSTRGTIILLPIRLVIPYSANIQGLVACTIHSLSRWEKGNGVFTSNVDRPFQVLVEDTTTFEARIEPDVAAWRATGNVDASADALVKL